MQIVVNGTPREVEPQMPLVDLLATLDLGERRFAVEVNETVVPRSRHAQYRLAAGDRVEIVQAIGGG